MCRRAFDDAPEAPPAAGAANSRSLQGGSSENRLVCRRALDDAPEAPAAAAGARGAARASGPLRATSAFRGVTHHCRTGRFEAHIWDEAKQVYLGARPQPAVVLQGHV